MDDVSLVDVLVVGVSVLIIIVLFAIAPITVACGLRSIILNDLLCIDVLKDATIFHGVGRSRMELARAIQGFVIVILIGTATSKPLDYVVLVVVFMRPLTPKVITVVTVPIPSFTPVPIVVATGIAVVESPTVVTVMSRGWWSICWLLLTSSLVSFSMSSAST